MTGKKNTIFITLVIFTVFVGSAVFYWFSASDQQQHYLDEARQQQAKLDEKIKHIKQEHTKVTQEAKEFTQWANMRLEDLQSSGETLIKQYKKTKIEMKELENKILSYVNSGSTNNTLYGQQDQLMGLSIGLEETPTTPQVSTKTESGKISTTGSSTTQQHKDNQ